MGAQGSARATLAFVLFGAGTNCVCAQAGEDVKSSISNTFFIGMTIV